MSRLGLFELPVHTYTFARADRYTHRPDADYPSESRLCYLTFSVFNGSASFPDKGLGVCAKEENNAGTKKNITGLTSLFIFSQEGAYTRGDGGNVSMVSAFTSRGS